MPNEDGVNTVDSDRDLGPTSNRIFNSEEGFAQLVGDESNRPTQAFEKVDPLTNKAVDLQYVSFELGTGAVLLDTVGDETRITFVTEDDCCQGSFEAPFAFPREILSTKDGEVKTTFLSPFGEVRDGEIIVDTFPGSIFGNTQYQIVQAGFSEISIDNFEGTIWDGITLETNNPSLPDRVETRDTDNFLLIEARPAIAKGETIRDELKRRFRIEDGSVTDGNAETSNDQDLFKSSLTFDDGFQDPLVALEDTEVLAIAKVVLGETDLTTGLDELAISPDQRNAVFTRVSIPLKGASDLMLDPNRHERFLFAAGDVDGSRQKEDEVSVHRFFISPGLEGYEEGIEDKKTVASGTRAFLRTETAAEIPLEDFADSGLFLVNAPYTPPTGDGARPIGQVLHADFGLKDERSTMSVTLGEVTEETKMENGHLSRDVMIGGRTLGSTRSDPVQASTFITSPLFSTAAGGGNPLLNKPGHAGYFVLENFEPEDPAKQGGIEKPLGNTDENQSYALLRLATATKSLPLDTLGTRSETALQGYSAGLAEFEQGDTIGIQTIDSGEIPDNVVLETDLVSSRVKATLVLSSGSGGQSTFDLGGLTGEGLSAFVDDDTFAAFSMKGQGHELALVSGELVKEGLPDDMKQHIGDYKHVKWGFFFGDTSTTEGSREHVHLGTWAVGKLPEPGDLPTIGTADYMGHAIGNVFNNGSLYTSVGSYRNDWDFGARRGDVKMGFDGTNYMGQTQLIGGSVGFTGGLNATDRTGTLRGNFVSGGTDAAAGQVGRFSIQQSPGAAAVYRASGTFAAER